nr:flagellar basal body protein [uncultured Duganella sp.]
MRFPELPVERLDKEGGPIQKPLRASDISNFAEMLARSQTSNVMGGLRSTRASEVSPTNASVASAAYSKPAQFGSFRSGLPPSTPRGSDAKDEINERALALLEYRLVLLASNIANADTPGYRARDIDVHEALRTGNTAKTVNVAYTVPSQGAVDGNSVEMDAERAKFAQNAILYEFHMNRVRGHYKDMEELLKSTPY